MSKKTPAFVLQFSPELFSLTPVIGGLSNHNYQLTFNRGGHDYRYFVRQLSSTYHDMDNQIDLECATQAQAASIGLAPSIVHRDEQGMICEWIAGQHWDKAAQCLEVNIDKLAFLVAKLHQQPMPAHQLDMTERLQHYYQTLNDEFKTRGLAQRLARVVNLIEQHLPTHRVGFCHHDMNPLNFLIDEQTKLYLLDWEFAAGGHCDFDIATLFQTFAWQESQQRLFLQYYNRYYPAANVTFSQLDIMAVVVEMMTLLWCMVMYQQDKNVTYLTLWQQSELAITAKINKLSKELQWDQ